MGTIISYISAHKIRALGLLVLLPLLGVGVFLALNPTVFKSKASGTKLFLETGTGTTTVTTKLGETVRAYVGIDPGGANVVGVDTVILYNSELFDVADSDINVPPDNGKVFGKYPVLKVESPGKIRISALAVSPDLQTLGNFVTARVLIANVVLHAKKEGIDTLTFGQDSIIADGQANNVIDLNSFQTLTATIISATGTPPPTPTPAPASPTLTQSPTTPYSCTTSSSYITDTNTGAEVTSLAPGAAYNMYIKFNVGGTDNSGDLVYTQYQAIFDNADRINVPGQCFWSNNQYTCAWENVLKAGAAGEHNIRFFVREVGTETAQCSKSGSPVVIRYTSQ